MKRFFVLITLLMMSAVVSYAQDEAYKDWKKCEKECTSLNSEIDKLEGKIKEENTKIKTTQSQLEQKNKTNNSNRVRLNGIENKIKDEQRKNYKLIDSLNGLKKEKQRLVKEYKDNVQKGKMIEGKLDTIKSDLSKVQNERKNKAANLENEIKEAEIKGKLEGESAGANLVYKKYKDNSFDVLVELTPYDYVKYDSVLLSKDKQKIDDMTTILKYINAKSCLSQKYNEKKVNKAIEDINYVINANPMSEEAKKLKESLTYYKDINDAFVKMVQKMDENNKKAPGETDKQKTEKKSGFMKMIGNFINRNVFDFDEYPYIGGKLVQIMKIKSSDEGVNKNVSYLLK